MIFKFESSFKQSIQGAPHARTKLKPKKDVHLSRGYIAGLKSGGRTVNYNMMAFKKQRGAKYGPTFQPTVDTPLLKMYNERQTLNGEFYGVNDPVTMNNFHYTKSLYDRRYPGLDASNQRKIFRDRERDRQNWRKVENGMLGLKGTMEEGFYGLMDKGLQDLYLNVWQMKQSLATSKMGSTFHTPDSKESRSRRPSYENDNLPRPKPNLPSPTPIGAYGNISDMIAAMNDEGNQSLLERVQDPDERSRIRKLIDYFQSLIDNANSPRDNIKKQDETKDGEEQV